MTWTRYAVVCALGAGLSATAVLAQQGMEWMPDGGRTLALSVFGSDPERIAEIAAADRSEAQWLSALLDEDAGLDEPQAPTLAGYLALNMPLAEPGALAGLEPAALPDALPADGKDLAIKHCQSCHSLFTGYLTHDRDKTGWMQTFQSPFHKEIPMSRTEIETFARYSEINMPMAFDEVPPEWRF